MKGLQEIIKHVSLLAQLGLSFAAPLVLCMLGCWWLDSRFELGAWIYIVGIVFGLGAAFMTAYKFYLYTVSKTDREKKKPTSFNDHS